MESHSLKIVQHESAQREAVAVVYGHRQKLKRKPRLSKFESYKAANTKELFHLLEPWIKR